MPVRKRIQPGAEASWGSEAELASQNTYPPAPWGLQSAPFENGLCTRVEAMGRIAIAAGEGMSHPNFAGVCRYLDGEPDRPNGGTRNEWNTNERNFFPSNQNRITLLAMDMYLPADWYQDDDKGPNLHCQQFHTSGAGPSPKYGLNILLNGGVNPVLRAHHEDVNNQDVTHPWSSDQASTLSKLEPYGWSGGAMPIGQWFRYLWIIKWQSDETGFVQLWINPDPLNKAGGGNPGYQKVYERLNYHTRGIGQNGDMNPKFGVYQGRIKYYWDNFTIGEWVAGETEAQVLAYMTPDGGSAPPPPPPGTQIQLRTSLETDERYVDDTPGDFLGAAVDRVAVGRHATRGDIRALLYFRPSSAQNDALIGSTFTANTKLQLTAYGSEQDEPCTLRLHGIKGNPAMPTETAEFQAIEAGHLTTAFVDWTAPAQLAGAKIDVPDLSDIFDEMAAEAGRTNAWPWGVYIKPQGITLGELTSIARSWDAHNRPEANRPLLTLDFTPPAAGTPVISAISPVDNPKAGGNTVIITGSGFTGVTGASGVKSGSLNFASYTVDSDTQISAVTPAWTTLTAKTITVTHPTNGASPSTEAAKIWVYDAPTIASISPSSGDIAGGYTAIITGSGFLSPYDGTPKVSAVTADGEDCAFTVLSDTQLQITLPAGAAAAAVDVLVETPGGTATSSGGFTYTASGVPSVLAIDPASGSGAGGYPVRLFGSELVNVSSVTVDGVAVTWQPVDSQQLLIPEMPAHAPGAVTVEVTAAAGSDGISFTYTASAPPLPPQRVRASGSFTIRGTGSEARVKAGRFSLDLILDDGEFLERADFSSTVKAAIVNATESDRPLLASGWEAVVKPALLANLELVEWRSTTRVRLRLTNINYDLPQGSQEVITFTPPIEALQ